MASQRHRIEVHGKASNGDVLSDIIAPDLSKQPTLASVAPTSGSKAAGNITITLTGTLFDAECAAIFDGNPLPMNVASATSATIVAPLALYTLGAKNIAVAKPRFANTTNRTFTINA